MFPVAKKDRIRLFLAITILFIVGIGLIWLTYSGSLQKYTSAMFNVFRNKHELREYLESWGELAPIAFIGIQALQVVLAPIPGEMTGVVGGFAFGAGSTAIYSTIGLTIGSILAFLAARIIGQPFVQLVISPTTMEKFENVTKKKGVAAAFIMFMIPGFPKDILSYLLGLSPLSFWTFLVICFLGRIPGTVLLSFSGSAIYDENWSLLIGLALLGGMMFGLLYWKRDILMRWAHRQDFHRADSKEPPAENS